MGNPNAPFGLRPVRHLFGGEIRMNEYNIADQYATALYSGDPVKVTGTGKNIGIATAGSSNKITGIFAGCEFVDSNGDTKFQKHWPASQVTKSGSIVKALVYDDPFILWEVMFDTLAVADPRYMTNLVSGVGNAVTGLSAWTAVAPPGGAENQVKVYGLSNCVNTGGVPNAYGAYAVGEVLIAQHEFALTHVSI